MRLFGGAIAVSIVVASLSVLAADIPWIDLSGTNRVPDSSVSRSFVGLFDSVGVSRVVSLGGNIDTFPVGIVVVFR